MTSAAQDKTYKIGDYYDDGNGLRGYVFEVSDNGKHGKIVGVPIRNSGKLLEPRYEELIKAGIPEMRNKDGHPMPHDMKLDLLWVDATSGTDGYSNTRKLWNKWQELKSKYNFDRRYLSDIESSLENRTRIDPFHEWYLPAIKELESLYAAVAQDDLDQLVKNDFITSDHFGNVGDRESYWKNYLKIPQGFFWSSTQNLSTAVDATWATDSAISDFRRLTSRMDEKGEGRILFTQNICIGHDIKLLLNFPGAYRRKDIIK